METTNFSEQESLAVIQQMINVARNSLQKGIADFIILWGALIAFISVLIFILRHTLTNPNLAEWAWTLCAVGWLLTFIKLKKLKRLRTIGSYTNTIFGQLWFGFGLACAILPAGYSLVATKDPFIWTTCFPIIVMMQGVCLFASSSIYKFKPFLYAALACWIFAFAGFAFPFSQLLLLAACEIISLVLPGYLLNKKAEQDV
jgi:hypothetical protein